MPTSLPAVPAEVPNCTSMKELVEPLEALTVEAEGRTGVDRGQLYRATQSRSR